MPLPIGGEPACLLAILRMRTLPVSSPWFTRFDARHEGALRVFCFPYAGGNATAFRHWLPLLPPDVELWAATYPGRVPRFAEPAIASMPLLVAALLRELPLDKPFVLFGHSLGGLVAFELLRALQQRGQRLPQSLFVAATRPPQVESGFGPITGAAWSVSQVKAQLQRLGGTPSAVLQHHELLDLLMPMLQADFALAGHQVALDAHSVQVPLFACAGDEDIAVPAAEMAQWAPWAAAGFALQRFAGDHFLLGNPALPGFLLQTLSDVLLE